MSKHAILIIKDKDKVINYYDSNWNCLLFPNIKVINELTKEDIETYLNTTINSYKELYTMTHTKYSYKDNINKEYTHIFYLVNVNINNDIFKYYSINELESNEEVIKKNKDILDKVKELVF